MLLATESYLSRDEDQAIGDQDSVLPETLKARVLVRPIIFFRIHLANPPSHARDQKKEEER